MTCVRLVRQRKLASLLGAVLLTGTAPLLLWAQSKPGQKPADRSIHSSPKQHSSTVGTTSGKSSTKKTGSKSSKNKNRGRERGQKAPTPERIQEIQTALAQRGSYTGAFTGKWDGNTVEAMKRFQASHGLNPSGKLDALTLQKLGLGSVVAGRSAPRPPATSPPIASAERP
jgi:peptidoglycan hydrolase-like protein with peptidoglycan-binding domain